MANQPILRKTARLLLLNEFNEILLMKINSTVNKPFWVTPGGKIEENETPLDTLKRELFEETGMTEGEFGPCLWHGQVDLMLRGGLTRFDENFYLTRVKKPAKINTDNFEEQEATVFQDYRWWTLTEIQSAQNEVFIPQGLSELLVPVLAGNTCTETLEIDLSTP